MPSLSSNHIVGFVFLLLIFNCSGWVKQEKDGTLTFDNDITVNGISINHLNVSLCALEEKINKIQTQITEIDSKLEARHTSVNGSYTGAELLAAGFAYNLDSSYTPLSAEIQFNAPRRACPYVAIPLSQGVPFTAITLRIEIEFMCISNDCDLIFGVSNGTYSHNIQLRDSSNVGIPTVFVCNSKVSECGGPCANFDDTHSPINTFSSTVATTPLKLVKFSSSFRASDTGLFVGPVTVTSEDRTTTFAPRLISQQLGSLLTSFSQDSDYQLSVNVFGDTETEVVRFFSMNYSGFISFLEL